jgi:hypothetical protein
MVVRLMNDASHGGSRGGPTSAGSPVVDRGGAEHKTEIVV